MRDVEFDRSGSGGHQSDHLLRKVLEETGASDSSVQTVPKLGYRFLPAVMQIWASASAAGTPIHGEERKRSE